MFRITRRTINTAYDRAITIEFFSLTICVCWHPEARGVTLALGERIRDWDF